MPVNYFSALCKIVEILILVFEPSLHHFDLYDIKNVKGCF